MEYEQPTHVDLFSGIGGFALAAQWAGFKTIAFSEIEPYASAVLRKHWPDVPNYGDVRTFPTLKCDLLTGGFPCQPFSCAGKRRGKADDRYLWPTMLDVIRRCRPTWICGENVTGIIDLELDNCITDLENAGYKVQPIIIPACAVDACHVRKRIWILANAASKKHERYKIQQSSSFETFSKKLYSKSELFLDKECWGGSKCGRNRSINGIPETMDEARLHAIGNAIVPQVAYQILKAIRMTF